MSTPQAPAAATTALVATRSAVMAMGFRCLFREQPHIHLLGIVDSATEACALWRQGQPQMVLIDAELTMSLGALQWQSLPPARVALLWRFRHRGARAFPGLERACALLRHCAELDEAIAIVRTMQQCGRPNPSECCADCWLQELKRPLALPLSPREQRVIELIGRGRTNQAIARTLGLNVKTVECYREDIKRKLGLTDSAALIKAAVLWRMGEVPDGGRPPPAGEPPRT